MQDLHLFLEDAMINKKRVEVFDTHSNTYSGIPGIGDSDIYATCDFDEIENYPGYNAIDFSEILRVRLEGNKTWAWDIANYN